MTTVEDLPAIQKAWCVRGRGVPRDVLSLVDIPVPSLLPGQVLVKVEAVSLNPVGYMIMGLVPNWLAPHNKIAEQDFAGTIVSISPPLPNLPQAQKLDIGQKVYGFCAQSPLKPQGALAQYIAVDARLVAPIPAKLSFEEAAGLGTVGITAVASLGDAKVQDGQNIFIVGGSTSIGIFAIQALKIKHCTVTVSCSAKNAELVMKLGADRVIDYTKGPVFAQLEAEAEHKQPYDVIIDCMGDMDLWRHSPSYLREGGYFSAPGTGFRKWSDVPRLVPAVLSAYLRPAWLGGVGGGRTFSLAALWSTPERLVKINQLVEAGLKPRIEKTYDFSGPFPAYDLLMSGRAAGKLVIRVG